MKLNTDCSESIFISGGNVFDGNNFSEKDILIENGYIAKIGKNLKCNADIVYNAKGDFVSCGLTDFHTHIKGISPDSIGIEADKISVPFGVSQLVDASAEMGGISNTVSPFAQISVFARVHIFGNRADFSMTEKMLCLYREKAIGIKVYYDTTFTEVSDITPLIEICKFARKRNLYVMVHITNSPVRISEIVDTLSSGDIISHAFNGGANNASENDFESLRAAKSKGILLDTAFAGFYHSDFIILKAAMAAGIMPDIISTDITKELETVNGRMYGIMDCMNVCRAAGMPVNEIFRAVSLEPALRVRKSVQIGQKADISIFDMNGQAAQYKDRYGNMVETKNCFRHKLSLHFK